MSKLGRWREPNWYWDQGWRKREVLALLRRNWKHRKKIAQQRRCAKPQPKRWWYPEGEEPKADPRRIAFAEAVRGLRVAREVARQQGRFADADAIRDRLTGWGLEVRDGRVA